MKSETFEMLLKQIDWPLKRMNWTFAGEPLINPNLKDFVNLAAERHIASKVDTNGMLLKRRAEELAESKLWLINVALEGTTQEVASTFRRGYDLRLVLKGLEKVCRLRDEKGTGYPVVSVNYLVKKQNESQMTDALDLAKKVGVDYITFKSISLNPGSWMEDRCLQELANKYLPDSQQWLRYKKTEGNMWELTEQATSHCSMVMSMMVVLWNGDVALCCCDYNGNHLIGNIKDSPIDVLWRSTRLSELRGKALRRELEMCKVCPIMGPIKKIRLRPEPKNWEQYV
jgi:radical SAM protein with 4Fe4S-binding SPASM domain